MLEILQETDFDQVYAILEQSFPEDERRPYDEQKALLRRADYRIYGVRDGRSGRVRAFVSVYRFEDFTYIEHFAVCEQDRNRGLGASVLQSLFKLLPARVCLEADPPETEIAARRIAFYRRNGLYPNPYPYMQPPISAGKRAIPLVVLTSGSVADEAEFCNIRRTLYRRVYRYDGDWSFAKQRTSIRSGAGKTIDGATRKGCGAVHSDRSRLRDLRIFRSVFIVKYRKNVDFRAKSELTIGRIFGRINRKRS